MVQHIRSSHSNEKPYPCNQCKSKFFKASELNQHKITHTKDKELPCNYCDKKFLNKLSIILHERKEHTLVKPYVCHICRQDSNQIVPLFVHYCAIIFLFYSSHFI